MDLGIAGKRAVVIGGSTGLGYAVAERLAAEGVNLLIFARDQQRLEEWRVRLMTSHAVQVDICAGDITKEPEVAGLANFAEQSGPLDILVLNTPRPPSPMRNFLDETDPDRWDRAFQDQLHGALLVLRTVTPLVARHGWGRVIAITSASVKQPMPRHALSTIFRAGVQAALKHLAMEVAGQGVTVNAVAPATGTNADFLQLP